MQQYRIKALKYVKDYASINFRRNPEKYHIGKGEQGVLIVEPYKSEILPFWKFRTPEIAKKSSEKIYELFLRYKKSKDFVGMDMVRKFLQMGYTRARRYANHASGRKYESNPQKAFSRKDEQSIRKNVLKQEEDWDTNEKAQSAKLFYQKYRLVKSDALYLDLKERHEKLVKSLKG